MEKKIAVENPVIVSGLTIIPVTLTLTNSWKHESELSGFMLKEPRYILASGPSQPVKVFGIDGQETDLEAVRTEFPELENELKKYSQR